MINRVVLTGRMTKDPELRRTPSGAAVTNFTLAVNRNYESQDGQQADFINCVVWNKIAENVERYCGKGSLVGVDGRLRSRSYENGQGQRVFVVEVACDSVQFLDTKNRDENRTGTTPIPAQHYNSTEQEEFNKQFDSFNIMEEDIQF
jgi:single-strand DNA-binding protein